MSTIVAAAESSGESYLVVPDTGLILWTVIAFVVALAFAILIGRAGHARGQSFWLLFLTSLVFSPVAGLIVLLLLPRADATGSGGETA